MHSILLEDTSEVRLIQMQQLHHQIVHTMKLLRVDFQDALALLSMKLPTSHEAPRHANCRSSFVFDDRLMQYTGLKDKNGVEIYEGDIVREYPDNEGYWVRVIEYNGHGFVLSKMASFLQHEIDWSKQVEVIGNVYENPELLGGDKAVQS